ncbi:hypothetical protein SD77_3541 [Bacillus badius]|uniref:Uncharacterized protein n=1 Tax=Bacillus badius TaxID=1455 RepID=A0ABR5AWI1_BACBA|nr:hypothetical protein SD78_1311 [Bacillus badius]KIL79121.1 hypothetical protein SD77_3541 [Bacillus badius]
MRISVNPKGSVFAGAKEKYGPLNLAERENGLNHRLGELYLSLK